MYINYGMMIYENIIIPLLTLILITWGLRKKGMYVLRNIGKCGYSVETKPLRLKPNLGG
jgi:hypothetical protein